jgi:hypothetical protein
VAAPYPEVDEETSGRLARWGDQLDVRNVTRDGTDLSAEAVAAYIAKYATKSTEALAALRLRAWAHALGFRGHWSTRSRRYSTTFTALRRARVVHAIRRRLRGGEPLDAWGRRASEEAIVILGTWTFVGRGYSHHDSAYMAVSTAGRTREYPDAA